MAAVVSFSDLKSEVVSILQASQSAFSPTPDGSNQMFASSDEIDQTILYVDAEVCTLIAQTLGHPFQTPFLLTSPVVGQVSPLPAHNGTVLRVYGQVGTPAEAVSVNPTAETITFFASHGFKTGDQIQFFTSPGGTDPGGLTPNTNYWVIYLNENTIMVATSYANALAGTFVGLGPVQPITSWAIKFTESIKNKNADEVKEAIQSPQYFQGAAAAFPPATFDSSFFFVEGDYLYCTSPRVFLVYTDYIKTTAPQAPENYRNAIVAGAVSRLAKDGFDESLVNYYANLYGQYMAQIASLEQALPKLAAYQGTGVPNA